METVEKEEFWGRVVAAPGEFESLVTEDAAWNACAAVVWRVVGGSLVVNGPPMLVATWEENLGLVPAAGDGLAARKAAILRRLCDMGLPVTVACLEAELARRLGEGMAGVSLSGGTLTVSLALTATEAQIAAAGHVLGRVLPQNIVTEMEWADGLPLSYTRLEYLESTGTQNILIPYTITYSTGLYLKGQLSSAVTETGIKLPFSKAKSNFPNTGLSLYAPAWGNSNSWLYEWGRYAGDANVLFGVDYSLFEAWNNWDSLKFVKAINCRTSQIYSRTNSDIWLWGAENENNFEATAQDFNLFNNSKFCIYRASIRQDFNEVTRDLIPALDETGTPCMFDLVTGKPFYNSGAGDFLYPGKEEEATTYSLRRPLTYAQMTAHGIRRLYHVPRGYNGTREEYAAEHGYKVLVETPAPEAGYWSPVWHETEEEIVLEWVETEPPGEDEGLIF